MNEVFLLVFKWLGVNGDGLDGSVCTTEKLVAQMMANPEYLAFRRSFFERLWTDERVTTENRIRVLIGMARYLSDLIAGDVPLLAPRQEVDVSVGLPAAPDADALRFGRALQRSIGHQVESRTTGLGDQVVAEIHKLLGEVAQTVVPESSRFLDTEAIAVRLNLSVKTVQRHCARGQIDADKTAGNEWRTTEDRLRRSRYLNARRRRSRDNGQLEL